MEWLVWMVAVAILGLAAVAASGRLGEFPATVTDTPQPHVPDGRLAGIDLRALRFAVVPRGYSMQQVDDLLERLSHQIDQDPAELVQSALTGEDPVPAPDWAPARRWAEAEPVAHADAEPQPPLRDEPEPVVEAELVAETDPEPKPEPVAELEPVAEPEPVVEAELVAETDPEPKPELIVEPEPVAEPEAVAEPEPEPVAVAIPRSSSRSKREPKSAPQPEPSEPAGAEVVVDDLDAEIAEMSRGQTVVTDYGAALDDLVSKYSFRKVEHWYELPGFDIPAPSAANPAEQGDDPAPGRDSAAETT